MKDKTGWITILRIPYSKEELYDVFWVWYSPDDRHFYSGWLENERGEDEQITRHLDCSPRLRATQIVHSIIELGWNIDL